MKYHKNDNQVWYQNINHHIHLYFKIIRLMIQYKYETKEMIM